jgi:putative hydrolase of the HAD superfamily
MIKAIIFDCFGVLATEGWLAFKWLYFKDSPEKMERASELNRMADAGLVTYKQFVDEVSAMAGVTHEELDHVLKNVSANEELLDFIAKELKPNVKIGLLSNVGDNWLYTIFSEDEIALFDAWELSHESGVTKPDPRAYEAIAHKLDVDPNECIFIDDQEKNVTGAQEVGMIGIQYTSFEQLVTELKKLDEQSR